MLLPPNIVILCYVNAHPLKYVQFPWLPYEGHAGHPVSGTCESEGDYRRL